MVSTPMMRWFLPGLLLPAQLLMGPAWGQQVPSTMFSVPITMSTATTTRVVAGRAGASIYVVQWNIIASGTTTVTFVTGTGTNCATGLAPLTGGYQLTAQVGAVVGVGNGVVLAVPAGQDLCITNSAAVAIPGSLAYALF